ncbi:ferrous iron transport protein B [Aquimarina hainanensis]|uniref:Ferrous iron transport protein B n=1 Tax=Aquimarina hainanensis TaxID=1578017 RepID=A0ABW5N6S5_9FLAO
MGTKLKVALIGNPNTGKTSVFNVLTGLNQQVGNYPGITVDKKEGSCQLSEKVSAKIMDLPGTYSLNASSLDENVAVNVLLDKKDVNYPDVIVVVCDVANLKRNLLLFTQIKELGVPVVLAINMVDNMEKKGISLDIPKLEEELKTRIVLISARKKMGIEALKESILSFKELSLEPCLDALRFAPEYFQALEKRSSEQLKYVAWIKRTQEIYFQQKKEEQLHDFFAHEVDSVAALKRFQQKETILRYQFINNTLKEAFSVDTAKATGIRERLDRILVHKFWGYIIFFMILLLVFQAIYDWSSYPMDAIDALFAWMSEKSKLILPSGPLVDLITEGIIPGVGGVVIFIPQIAFLFFFIAMLEESGYMSRAVFLMDRTMRKFGLSGKSVVPLISGTACAIPAVMAARNIENWKERLITILVVPFTTCSARLPVYLIIISLVIPEEKIGGVISYQGLTMLVLYILGFVSAVGGAWLLNKLLKIKNISYFVIEMPDYKVPLFKNVLITVLDKTKAFVFDAGKIILAISVVLWGLASFGPNENFNNAATIITEKYPSLTEEEKEHRIASYQLEHSFIGYAGKAIEPVVAPLGYDWKIGIGVISSFAAREVFVGTLATIYSIDGDNEDTIKNKMAAEIHPVTGKPLYNLASGISLLLFYAFAMQCMSTLAIVKRETNSWKWPMLQFFVMSGFAYIIALIAYQLLI